LVTTVDSIKNKYSVRQYSNTKIAQILQITIGMPSTKDLIKYVEGNMNPNFHLTRQDIIFTEDICGPNRGSLKGKMTRAPTQHVRTTCENVPKDKIPFTVTTSRNIHWNC